MLMPSNCTVKGTVRIILCLVQVISLVGLRFLYLSRGNGGLSPSFHDCQVGHGPGCPFPGQISQAGRPRTQSTRGSLPGAPSRPVGLKGGAGCTGAGAPCGSGSGTPVLPLRWGRSLQGHPRLPCWCLRLECRQAAGATALPGPVLCPPACHFISRKLTSLVCNVGRTVLTPPGRR